MTQETGAIKAQSGSEAALRGVRARQLYSAATPSLPFAWFASQTGRLWAAPPLSICNAEGARFLGAPEGRARASK